MKTAFIYALNDPESGKCRYVGKTERPNARLFRHISEAKSKSNTHKNRWILSLLREGRTPNFEILDEVPYSQWEFWEREYIRVFRALGLDLTNATDGGEGGTTRQGRKASEETKKKMRAALVGAKNPRFGKKPSPETCAKISDAGRRRAPISEETRAKMRAWQIGKKFSDETRERMRAAWARRRNGNE